jgi:hypothetical protein
MNINIFSVAKISDERILELIGNRESFTLTDIVDMSRTVLKLEEIVEKQKLTCRITTQYKSALYVGSLIPPLAIATGLFALGNLAHKAATRNPDYLIEKNYFKKSIDVNRQKK